MKIDGLLHDECLWSAPRFLDNELPLASGGRAPSFDGPLTFYDIRDGEKQWGGIQVSWRLGVPGNFRAVVLATAFDKPEPEYVDRDVFSTGIILKKEGGDH